MTLFKCQMYLARTALIGDTFHVIESIKPSVHIPTETFFSPSIFYDSVLTVITVREIHRLYTPSPACDGGKREHTCLVPVLIFVPSVVRSRRILKSLVTVITTPL